MVRMVKSRTITASGAPVALTVPAGETFDLLANVIDPDAGYLPVVLTGSTLTLYVRAPDGTIALTKVLTITDAINGAAVAHFAAADLTALAGATCQWDLWLVDAAGNRTQIVSVSLLYVADAVG